MAKPFREEDIPTILDRETGKLRPLFKMPGQKEQEEVAEKQVKDAPSYAELEKELANTQKKLTDLQNGIKNAFIAEFGKDAANMFKNGSYVEVIEQLISDFHIANSNVTFLREQVKEKETRNATVHGTQPTEEPTQNASAPRKAEKQVKKSLAKAKKDTKKTKKA